MNRLFLRIRWGLVAWSMLILGVILVLLGGAIYVAVERSLRAAGQVTVTTAACSTSASWATARCSIRNAWT
jgi:hypothetical protein